jgi:hypothetical protein
LCSVLPGDFVCAGISYGVAARIIFDFVNFATLGKTLHLVDPFDGRLGNEDRRIAQNYNQDIDSIIRQYPKDAPIEIHRASIPINLKRPLAFVYTATGDPKSAAEAMKVFYADLVPGGMIVANEFDRMQSLGALDSRSLWLPSGQGLLIKGPS